MVEPVFEGLAGEKGSSAAFTKVDLGVGLGGSVASEWGVRVTPTFLFFLDGNKVSFWEYCSYSLRRVADKIEWCHRYTSSKARMRLNCGHKSTCLFIKLIRVCYFVPFHTRRVD